MTDFVGDNDHGDTVPPTIEEILMRVTQQRDKLYAQVYRLETRVAELLTIQAELLSERDNVRREICMISGGKGGRSSHISPDAIEYAKTREWNCFTDYQKSQEALDKLSNLDEQLGLQ